MAGELNDAVHRRPAVWLGRLPSLLAAGVLFALMAMTFFDVVLRSVLNNPIESATELTRLFMAIIVFASMPVVSWKGGHIVVDLLDSRFGPAGARIRDAAVNLLSGVCLLWPAVRVWQLADRAREYGDVTEYLRIPQFYIAYFIAVATLLTALVMILRGLLFAFAPHKIIGDEPALIAAHDGSEERQD